jgi:hypothetical protein
MAVEMIPVPKCYAMQGAKRVGPALIEQAPIADSALWLQQRIL